MAGIFKSYDVRGTTPEQLNSGDAYRIGKAAVAVLKAKTLAVGRDARLSSPDLMAALTAGITAAGCEVLDLGMGPTPISYFAAGKLGSKRVQGAIQVTASHNPAEYGGFKFTKADALPMSYDSGLADVESLVRQDRPSIARRPGKVRGLNLMPAYQKYMRGFAKLNPARPLKAAFDTGNGVAGVFLPSLLRGLPVRIVPLYFKPDGRFPNHEANPLKPENLQDLRRAVIEKHCDLGIAFDGDGDRVVFVDETGEPVPGDLAGALMARELLKTRPGAAVLYDVRATRALAEVVREAGGRALETRVGHSHIKAGLRREHAVLGAELSGHYYFHDFFCSDSGEIAMFLILSVLARSQVRMSELVNPLRRFHHSGEINFQVADVQRTIAAVEARYAPAAKGVSRADGISIDLGSWWFNLRPSNTEPVVRLALESLRSREEMESRKAELSETIKSAG